MPTPSNVTDTARKTRRDIRGGLEIQKVNGRGWSITVTDGTTLTLLSMPRKRNATAVRQLYLNVIPDWTQISRGYWPDVTDGQRKAVGDIARMVSKVQDRQFRRVCLGCGCLPGFCVCGTEERPDGPHYTTAELEWAR
jgi:hypothetical protein